MADSDEVPAQGRRRDSTSSIPQGQLDQDLDLALQHKAPVEHVAGYAPMTVITSEQRVLDGPRQRHASDLMNRAFDHGLRVAAFDIVSYKAEANLFESARPDVWRITFEARP